MRVLTVIGTRPEAVKMAPVIRLLARTPGVEAQVCITAQHRQMLDQVLRLFHITPDVDLDLMQPNQSLAGLTAAILTHLDPVLTRLAPDWMLVQGDTTTVLAAALLAYYHHIRVGHVEAGLRTGDKLQPFPEEVNRQIAGVLADLHFAPTQHSRQNLLREGVPDGRIVVTGNPVIDALDSIVQRPAPPEVDELLARCQVGPGGRRLVLVTAHRRENFGAPLENICAALRRIAAHYPDTLQLVYPVHLNPNIQGPVRQRLSGVDNITLLDPLDYLPMVHLMRRAALVLTDSGGIQEEATAMGIPTLVLRRITERPEGIQAGVLKLVGADSQAIYQETCRLLDDPAAYRSMSQARNPFGDGHAAEHIVQALLAQEAA
ncbi:MAG: UDP-N-acetylglucosamine 2-epimerase (non-hydrolyzing) [Chloroflexi bacterium]|nr:UDP-N-acetylglucosamine 2-epimerase (non-hydrolyzing) [Chloroflexota bacterium]